MKKVNAGVWAVLLGTLGCSAGDEGGAAPVSAEAPANGAILSESDEAEGKLLFEAELVGGARLRISEFTGDRLGMSMAAPIGVELPSASFGQLSELYGQLASPTPEALEALRALDAMAPEVEPPAVPVVPESEKPGITVKTQAAFNSTVCKTFREGSWEFVARRCRWTFTNDAGTSTREVALNDRVYAYNNNDANSSVWWNDNVNPSIVFHLPQYWWTWTSVSGTAATLYRYNHVLRFVVCNNQCDLGATWHERRPYVK